MTGRNWVHTDTGVPPSSLSVVGLFRGLWSCSVLCLFLFLYILCHFFGLERFCSLVLLISSFFFVRATQVAVRCLDSVGLMRESSHTKNITKIAELRSTLVLFCSLVCMSACAFLRKTFFTGNISTSVYPQRFCVPLVSRFLLSGWFLLQLLVFSVLQFTPVVVASSCFGHFPSSPGSITVYYTLGSIHLMSKASIASKGPSGISRCATINQPNRNKPSQPTIIFINDHLCKR